VAAIRQHVTFANIAFVASTLPAAATVAGDYYRVTLTPTTATNGAPSPPHPCSCRLMRMATASMMIGKCNTLATLASIRTPTPTHRSKQPVQVRGRLGPDQSHIGILPAS